MLDIFAMIVLLVIAAAGIWLVVFLGNLPGNIAREAGHPQARAITVSSWIGLLTLGVGWFIALIWANTSVQTSNSGLEARVRELETRLEPAE